MQAVCSERTGTGVATPVTLFASLGGDVKVVLGGAALILAFPKEQDLAWVSAGGAAALGIAASTMPVALLASLVIIQIMPREAGGATGTNVGQNQTSVARGAGERPSILAASAGGMASFTSASLFIVSRRAVWNAVISKQQVAGMLAL